VASARGTYEGKKQRKASGGALTKMRSCIALVSGVSIVQWARGEREPVGKAGSSRAREKKKLKRRPVRNAHVSHTEFD